MKTETPSTIEKTSRRGNHHQRPNSPTPLVHREFRDHGVVVLTFDRADSAANAFDPSTLAELDCHLDDIAGNANVRGLVLTSAKPTIFVAGADLDFVAQVNGDELTAFIELGQQVFSKVASLPVATVAAIHGACLGGGLELALACDYRVASPDKATRIGLPETQLGILPAWGGSTRLPPLIGLPKALELITSGKILASRHARTLGVVDALVPRERMVDFAVGLIQSGKSDVKRTKHWLTNNRFSARLIRRLARRKALEKTRGNYPAIARAIDVACAGVGVSMVESLELERRVVIELAGTHAAKQLMRIFHLQEHARKFHANDESSLEVERTAVIGAGVMGAGIAHCLSSKGFPTVLQDLDEARVADGMNRIATLYASGVKRHLFTAAAARRLADRLSPTAGAVPLENTDLVIEAAVENLEVKKAIFRDLCSRVRPDTILATNTSALPIADLAGDPQVTHPERLIGLHFFNPVHRMKLVEVVVTEYTSPAVIEAALRFVRSLGKLPVVVRDRPGFLVNRVLMPYLIEAGRLFDRGVDPRKIDEAMLDFGMPMGPLRLLDEVGLDVAMHVAATMESAFGQRFAAPPVLGRLVEKGLLGRKAGEGFFKYSKKRAKVSDAALECRTAEERVPLKQNDIAERLSLLMVNEAFRALDEGVATSEDDVDFAMILGTGFAPFRGGPVTYARRLGFDHVRERLEAIGANDDESDFNVFEPAGRLNDVDAGDG